MAALEQVLIPKSRYERLIEISEEHSKCKDYKETMRLEPEDGDVKTEPDDNDETIPVQDKQEPHESPTSSEQMDKDYDSFEGEETYKQPLRTLKHITLPRHKNTKTVKRTLKKTINKVKKPSKSVKWVKW